MMRGILLLSVTGSVSVTTALLHAQTENSNDASKNILFILVFFNGTSVLWVNNNSVLVSASLLSGGKLEGVWR